MLCLWTTTLLQMLSKHIYVSMPISVFFCSTTKTNPISAAMEQIDYTAYLAAYSLAPFQFMREAVEEREHRSHPDIAEIVLNIRMVLSQKAMEELHEGPSVVDTEIIHRSV